MSQVNEPLLGTLLGALGAARTWPGGLVDRIGALARSPDEFAPYRVNPLRCAQEWQTDPRETVNAFLVAAKSGMFAMQWDVLCTGCGDLVERFDSLSFLHASFRCTICNYEYETTLDDAIEVSFTLSPAVRDLAARHPEALSIEEFYYRWLLNQGGLVPDGTRYVDYIRPWVRAIRWLDTGESARETFTVTDGVLTGFDGVRKSGFWVEVRGEPVTTPQPLQFVLAESGWTASVSELRPGPVTLTLEHRGGGRGAPFVFFSPPGGTQHPSSYAPYLSAKKLFNVPLFRELFRGEVMGGTTGLKAKDLTFLFTDLTGSTALYERIGDVKAYALVHQHFDTLGGIIARRGGAIVKTIGDAVMATFDLPAEAAAAAAEMQQDIQAFNRARGNTDLLLKIGLHRGPCLAVTSNDRVDFFGQTVNLASRVQALAGPEEVCLTSECYEADGVRTALAGWTFTREDVAVRGLHATVAVYRGTAPSSG